MLSDLERRVKILQCLSTSLTKIHSARATGGGGDSYVRFGCLVDLLLYSANISTCTE